MKNGRMQAKDIPDETFLAAVRATVPMHPGLSYWRDRGDVRQTLEAMLDRTLPEPLFLAKARALGAKRQLEGCTRCTCRGDYHLPDECRNCGCCYPADFDWSRHPAFRPELDTKASPGAPTEASRDH